MSAQLLEKFVQAPAPGFRCFAAPGGMKPRFLARVRHILNLPASDEDLARIGAMLGAQAPQVEAFYRRHNGFILYQDTLSAAAGVELLPVEKWEDATEDMRDWFSHLEEDPENDPDHIVSGIAIATVPHSGNYFVMPVQGPSSGKIFYADHDGWYESAFAEDFDGFLAHVTEDPAHLLAEEVGCYTRYYDGASDNQWIPEEYFEDISRVQA